ncbi:hemerythrin domain-containing protein [Mycolicibacillus parakoreensis]|uniref:Hemerythrin domain-containing protein n=1 Tax=Mycolicibacillus parakoreensis TaxID=1069221 RepID=A0ABY3U153_9MYCO|nr:hemerythrin domain-containing protein [Mycolicibacillus parakoreensis]MCV7316789.1 hemerythrin domain-containing protein [Mycolicibacillus parakoreensis]ULN51159.1 hemerythrin domain-containing protein [Mycolicibacillus parakoreensis]HLR99716.1 hemerythrin domain-containing protein [Mycolicibacillus parakoreensis]
MSADTADTALSAILEREHHEIDAGIERFLAVLADGTVNAAALTTALEALRRHIYLEEVLLFPPLRVGALMMPIMVMIREHGQMWQLIEALDAGLADAADSAQLERDCRELMTLLERHNSKEEPVIYPHADADMPPQADTKLRRFLDGGTTPDGWVCQQAAIG